MSRKLIYSAEAQAGITDFVVMEECLSDGSKVYNVETHGSGGYYHTLANATDEKAAIACVMALIDACHAAAE